MGIATLIAALILGSGRIEEQIRLSDRAIVMVTKTPTWNTVTAIATEKGVIVVDTSPSPALAAELRAAITAAFGRSDFIYTINTHHHWDHVFGNQAFADTTIIAHERMVPRMRRSIPATGHPAPWLIRSPVEQRRKSLNALTPQSEKAEKIKGEIQWFEDVHSELSSGFKATFPTMTFRDRLNLDMGDCTLILTFYGAADTDNSIIVHVPEEGLLISGDLFWYGGVFSIFENRRSLDIPRWIETLNDVIEHEPGIRWLVGGHRDVWPGEHLHLRKSYIVQLWREVRDAKREGINLEEAIDRLAYDRYPQIQALGIQEALRKEGKLEKRDPRDHHRDNVKAFWLQEP